MRIGIDARLWNETGVGRYIRNLVEQLAIVDKKNEYILFVRNSDAREILKQVQNDKFKVIEADIRWHSIDEQLRFPSIIDKQHLDLMHFPYFSVPIFYKRKFIVTIHDLIPLHVNTGLATTLPGPLYKGKRLGYKLVLRQGAKNATKIIAVSQSTKDEVVKYLHVAQEKVIVTYEGVDKQVSSSKYVVSSIKEPYFLYVGNAYPHKNLDRLIQAVQSSSEDIRLMLVGKEDYFYKRLKEKWGDNKRIVFKGQVSDEELASLYQNAQALILPSFMEGFGLPALEAMANNCLVLCSDIAAFREVCGEAAIYFNPFDVDDIAKKMIHVEASLGGNKKKEGFERVKNFSWQKMAKETLRIYEEVGK